MSLRNQKESYYCTECGLELSHKGRLCSDCNRESRSTHKRSKSNDDEFLKMKSGKSGSKSRKR